ncbi:hypothetical protein QFC19_004266 [Naganishia cerealis]|uniref:Uncharacterized protein n=1 Tax=Naganishia cerealis TaxID=610337 RepID=A0ACC2VWE1_9TREE|nr:hypothetical protein QFC19_004266 [Naganishia cerealis]
MSDTDSSDALSDVSLDEEDEELIWRVFYNTRERNLRAESHEFEMDDQVEVESISDLSDIDEPELVNEYRNLKSGTIGQNLTQEEKNKLIV